MRFGSLSSPRGLRALGAVLEVPDRSLAPGTPALPSLLTRRRDGGQRPGARAGRGEAERGAFSLLRHQAERWPLPPARRGSLLGGESGTLRLAPAVPLARHALKQNERNVAVLGEEFTGS